MRYFILLFFLFYNTVVVSQAKYHKDSIIISEFKKKVIQHINPKPDSALYYIKKSFKLAEKKNYQNGIADTEYLYAQYFRRTQQIDSASYYLESSAKRAENKKYSIGAAIAYNGLCRNLYLLGKYKEAEIACDKALKNINSDRELSYMTKADTYTALGTIYSRQDFIEKAQIYFLKVDSMHNQKALRPDVIAAAYQNLGGIYLKFNDLDLAESYYLKANNQFEKLPSTAAEYYMSTNNIELGKLYFKKKKLNKADTILTKAQSFFYKINDLTNAAEIGIALAKIKLEKNQLEDAELLFKKSFDFFEQSKYNLEAATNAIELAKLSLLQNNLKKTLSWAQIGLQLNKSINNSLIEKELAFIMADTYTQMGNHEKANNLNKIGYKIKDSLNEIQIAEKIKEIEGKYQTSQRDKEISTLKAENELALQQKKNQRDLLLGGIIIIGLLGLFFYLLYRNRKKTAEKLKELDTAKSNFFANISHEFRTPLTLITNPIETILEDDNLSDNKRQQFEMAKRNSDRLLSLINQLLDLSKIDAGQLRLNIQQSNVISFISALGESFSYSAKQKSIDYSLNISPYTEDVFFDRDALEKIVLNLISNAIKYTPENGTIQCDAFIENATLYFKIENSGKGLTETELNYIFQRFYKTDDQNQGTGIGLALVKELVDLNQGKIHVKSSPNKSNTFTVILPVDKHSFKDEHFITTKESNTLFTSKSMQTNTFEPEEFVENEQPILLIVEDNDDVRTLLKQTFESTYNILLASNGDIGIKLALEHIPDLIISDIMMPITDGIQLTERLKNDELTSHIPIILLTAKAGDENAIKGIEIGADDYITKPFNSKFLKTKVSNLISIRNKLQNRYSQEIILSPKDIGVTNLDEEFLKKVQQVLKDKLVESSFNVEDFSKAVGMSRMQLHRKIKALTGLSASEFVRSQRLKLAADLLKTSDINISQVGYSVGFNDHSYFAKTFKEAYNCTPTEFAKGV